jgi:hypothetical protein
VPSSLSGKVNTPPSTPSDVEASPNLDILNDAFSEVISGNSSIASSQSSSKVPSRTTSIQSGYNSNNDSSSMSQSDVDELLGKSTRGSEKSTTSQQSVVNSINSLRAYRSRILQLQMGLNSMVAQQKNNIADEEKQTEEVTAKFSPVEDGSLIINNSSKISSNFSSASSKTSSGLDYNELNERLAPLAAEQQDEAMLSEDEDLEPPKKKIMTSHPSYDINSGGKKKKSRHHKKGKASKKKKGKAQKGGKKTKKGKKHYKTLKNRSKK